MLRPSPDHVPGHPVRGGDELAVRSPAAGGRRPGSCSRRRRPSPRRWRVSKASATSSSVVRFTETPRPWLPSTGFTTTGKPMALRGVDRVLGVADVVLARHRQAEVGEQPRAELLVGGDLDGGVRGLRWSAPPRCASGTCPGRPGSGWRRSGAPRGCRAPRPRGPAPAPRARARGGRRNGRSRRSPRRCRSARPSRGAIELEDDARAPPRRPRARPPRTRSRRAPRPRRARAAGARHRHLGRRAGAVLQRDRDLGHQLAEAAVGLLQPLGEGLARLAGGGRARPGQQLEERRERVAHSRRPASSARRCRSTVRRISGCLA